VIASGGGVRADRDPVELRLAEIEHPAVAGDLIDIMETGFGRPDRVTPNARRLVGAAPRVNGASMSWRECRGQVKAEPAGIAGR